MDFDIFGRTVTDKVGNQKKLFYATSNNLGNTKITFSLNWIVLHIHNAPVRCLPERKKCHM